MGRVKFLRQRHPAGFDKYQARVGRLALAVHAWHGADAEFHDHRFSFVSLIVAGRMTEELAEVTPGDTHRVLTWDESCQLQPTTGTTGVKITATRLRGPARVYVRRWNELHRVTQMPRLTVLVKWYHPHRTASVVLRETQGHWNDSGHVPAGAG